MRSAEVDQLLFSKKNAAGSEPPNRREDDVRLLRLMAIARESDRREGILFRQGRGRFQLPGAGHEALAVLARVLRPSDLIFPHYRDRALVVARGVPNIDVARAFFGKATAAEGGRQLPSHHSHRACNLMSCASPTGLQCLPAAGAAWAQQRAGTGALMTLGIGLAGLMARGFGWL